MPDEREFYRARIRVTPRVGYEQKSGLCILTNRRLIATWDNGGVSQYMLQDINDVQFYTPEYTRYFRKKAAPELSKKVSPVPCGYVLASSEAIPGLELTLNGIQRQRVNLHLKFK
jgi:hypothetical protein